MSLAVEFAEFLHASPTPYHACVNLSAIFQAAGYTRLQESEAWNLKAGGKYYYTRGDSSFAAFVNGSNSEQQKRIRVIGAHTDSPCLKVKPNPDIRSKGYLQLGVAVYGGALLAPWFDRDLSLAGMVTYANRAGNYCSLLVNFDKPIAIIPSLAIHLDREANNGKALNAQKQMNAIVLQDDAISGLNELLLAELQKQDADATEVLDHNLSFYDTQAPAVIGAREDFLAGARLDNLISCYMGARAMLAASGEATSILICNDHEEIGSRTELGAQGPMLSELIDRLYPNPEARQLALRNGLMLSVDNAHGVHPNFADKHDDKHGPVLNQGPVIKFDANQSYATGATSASVLRGLARTGPPVPLQQYMTRADMACGSTIGPLTATKLGITTVDLGVATFAMHSIRETAGVKDLEYLRELLARFVSVTELPFQT